MKMIKDILVVEDEAITSLLISENLKRAGYTVTGRVEHGEEALKILTKTNSDLVLLDIHLAGEMDGIDLAWRLREEFDIPFIFLTAYSDQKTLERASSAQPYGFLIKPFNDEDLRAALEIAAYKIEADKRVKESEKKFRLLVQNSSDMICVLDRKGNFTYVSCSFTRILGYDPGLLHGRSMLDFVHPEHKETLERFFNDPTQITTSTKAVELKILNSKGEYRWIESTYTMALQQPEIQGVIVNSRDITDYKIHQTKLLETNRELRKINHALDSFVYKTSHDLRAPLCSVLGLIDLLRRSDDVFEKERYVRLMESSIHQLDGFIQEIIYYSRNAHQEVKSELISFKELLEEIKDELHFMEGTDEIKFVIRGTSEMELYSDSIRLKTILKNLLSNAFKYMDPSKIEQRIELNYEVAESGLKCRIQDNGLGISKEHMGKVFQMFYRASEQQAGSGLGLYIVKETLDKLNGKIQLESDLGVGTTATFYIPNLVASEVNTRSLV